MTLTAKEENDYCWGPGCENEIPKIETCCNGSDCGCMGIPIAPPFCSNECRTKWSKAGSGNSHSSNEEYLKLKNEVS